MWLHLMKQVTFAFTDKGKRNFVEENGLKAVVLAKGRSKNVPGLEKEMDEFLMTLFHTVINT